MGMVLIGAWILALVVLGIPALILSYRVTARTVQSKPFRLARLAALVLGVAAQYAFVISPFAFRGSVYLPELVMAPMFGWHMAFPLVIAGILWFLDPEPRRPAVSGIVSGLLLSIPAVIVLAPLGCIVPWTVLGLRLTH